MGFSISAFQSGIGSMKNFRSPRLRSCCLVVCGCRKASSNQLKASPAELPTVPRRCRKVFFSSAKVRHFCWIPPIVAEPLPGIRCGPGRWAKSSSRARGWVVVGELPGQILALQPQKRPPSDEFAIGRDDGQARLRSDGPCWHPGRCKAAPPSPQQVGAASDFAGLAKKLQARQTA